MTIRKCSIAILFCTACFMGCGGGGPATPPAQVTVSVAGLSAPINAGASHTFTASVKNSSNQGVTWSVVEVGGGSISQSGVYTAPPTPGTFTVKATAMADSGASATAPVPVVIPEGHIAGYGVGVDYHATAADFLHTAFVTIYDQSIVRQTVRTQLQGMADRGATVISTRIWLVTEPGTDNFGETWRATFPLSDQEQSNLHTYAQDVAAIQGSGGNRLRLDICLLWLGAADYTMGTPTTGLGFTPVSGAVFTARVQTTTDKVLAAVTGVNRPDGVPVVDIIYLNGEVMVGAKANEDWFMTTHYPRFVSVVNQAGFKPSVYFIVSDTQDDVLQNDYIDADYPILDNHRSMFWVYRTMRFMSDQGLPIPSRIDFSYYVPSTGATYPTLLTRVLDDADATLPSLGASQSYAAAETFYYQDPTQLLQSGQSFASEAATNTRLHSVTFWTTPDGGGSGIDMAYPFAFEDYLPPPSTQFLSR
jgi:predicted component of type VI protein secretion system